MRRAQPIVVAALVMTGLAVSMGTALAAAHLGINASPNPGPQAGVVVGRVAPEGPAAKAGVKPGDVILGIDSKPVPDLKALADAMQARKAGDKVTLKVKRDGKEESLVATLADAPAASPDSQRRELMRRRMMERVVGPILGVYPQRVTPELKDRLGLGTDKGVIVMDVVPESPAAKAGLKRDDVITTVNNQPVTSEDELRDSLRKARESPEGKDVTLRVMRGKQEIEVKAKLAAEPMKVIPQIPGMPPGRPGDYGHNFRQLDPQEIERLRRESQEKDKKEIEKLRRQVQELEKHLKELEKRQSPP